MILKRAEETSKITNVIFRKLRKEIECMKPYKMIKKKKEQQKHKQELFEN